jgi:hypothetical protein
MKKIFSKSLDPQDEQKLSVLFQWCAVRKLVRTEMTVF